MTSPGLDEVFGHLERVAPEEGCGVIFRNPAGGLRVVPMANQYDRYARADPATFPRSNKTAYKLDELELARHLEAAEAAGETLACIFHSHVGFGAYFSNEDREMAAPPPGRQPAWPGVSWLVVAVVGGRVTGARLFVWDHDDFREAPLKTM